MGLNFIDQLVYITARIDCTLKSGDTSCGTGFFFNFCGKEKLKVPTLVTNKHVVEDSAQGELRFTLADKDDNPILGKFSSIKIDDFEDQWIFHEDPEVDLAVLPINPVVEEFRNKKNEEIYYMAFDFQAIPNQKYLENLNSIEDILMIGYPNGLWDSVNNIPIFRQGITATPVFIDYETKPEFLIDCACFPGSSGSPVLLANFGAFIRKDGKLAGGPRSKLLGILYAGPTQETEGEIKAVPIPTGKQKKAILDLHINLGYCVKASQLIFFEDYFQKLLKK